ncbi:MAG: insulinase family protein, partial [Treponema sp.]|nr:insulinase family protein [Treponema sp.]
SRFAQRPVLGCLEILETATVEHLKGFYERWYRADNMAVIFVGDFDGAVLEASLADHFLIEAPPVPTPRTVFELPPPQSGSIEAMVLTDPELTDTYVMLYFRHEQPPRRGNLADFRGGIIDYLVHNMITMRLDDIGAWLDNERWGANSGFHVMGASAGLGMFAEETLIELLRAKEAIRRHGFNRAEIDLAKQAMVSRYRRMVQEMDRRDSGTLANMFVEYFIEGEWLFDLEWQFHAILQLLPGIRVRDINAAAQRHFASNDIRAFVFAPESESEFLPGYARVMQLVAHRGRLRVQRPRTRAVAARLIPVAPERGSVVLESVDDETGAVIWGLGNGARVILKPTGNRNDEIALVAMARGGTSCVPREDSVSAAFAVDMMELSGLGPWTPSELSRMLATRQASLAYWICDYTRSFEGFSTTGDLITLFEMIHLSFTDPRIEIEGLRTMMDYLRAYFAFRGADPQTVFSDAVNRMVTNDHPGYRTMEWGDLARVDMVVAQDFLRRSLNPADFTFVFAGNLTPELMRGYVETYLASIPPGEEGWNSWTDPDIVRPSGVEYRVFVGMEEQSTVHMAWFAPADFTEHLNMATGIFEGYLNTRLWQEIRENLGGVYSIAGEVSIVSTPRGELSMWIGFECDPRRVPELSDAVLGLLDRMSAGLSRGLFDNAVEAMHREWEATMRNNFSIAWNYVNSAVLFDLPLSRLQRRPRYIDAVTPADIQGIAARLLENGPIKVVLLPGN